MCTAPSYLCGCLSVFNFAHPPVLCSASDTLSIYILMLSMSLSVSTFLIPDFPLLVPMLFWAPSDQSWRFVCVCVCVCVSVDKVLHFINYNLLIEQHNSTQVHWNLALCRYNTGQWASHSLEQAASATSTTLDTLFRAKGPCIFLQAAGITCFQHFSNPPPPPKKKKLFL